MRNPWGAFEWSGDWCDDSPKWDQNPKVKKACKASGKKEDDGLFWMEWADFQKHFQNIDVCHRSRGIADVRLDINEDAGCIGPVKGCLGNQRHDHLGCIFREWPAIRTVADRRLRGVLLLLQGGGAALLPDGPQGRRPAQAQGGGCEADQPALIAACVYRAASSKTGGGACVCSQRIHSSFSPQPLAR